MLKLQFKDNPARGIWLVGDKATLGSDPHSTLVLTGPGIQPTHAEISIAPGDNLTLKCAPGACHVNNLSITEDYQLKVNDVLRIAEDLLVLVDPKEIDEDEFIAGFEYKKQEITEKLSGWSINAKHPKLQGRDFSIAKSAVLGRSTDCEFAIPYKLLSREHARFSVKEGQLLLEDLGSANGTFVNGKRVKQAKLSSGDIVAFAKMEFEVEGPPGSEQAMPEEDEDNNQTMIRSTADIQKELEKLKQEQAKKDSAKPSAKSQAGQPQPEVEKTVQLNAGKKSADKKNSSTIVMIVVLLIVGIVIGGTKVLGYW